MLREPVERTVIGVQDAQMVCDSGIRWNAARATRIVPRCSFPALPVRQRHASLDCNEGCGGKSGLRLVLRRIVDIVVALAGTEKDKGHQPAPDD